jgi:ADP-ribosyl-[dinitrogen reductase] hydrolase
MTGFVPQSDHAAADRLRDRFRGLLLGLALGDALGSSVQHRRAGTFARVADLRGGGPYDLPPGAWSDDTATALHCADSLIVQGHLDEADLWRRWTQWRLAGDGSATGQCLGITAAMAGALSREPGHAQNAVLEGEPLPRVAVIAAFGFADRDFALQAAVQLTRLTHPSASVTSAAALYAGWVVAALEGVKGASLFAVDESINGAAIALSAADRSRLLAGGWAAAEEMIQDGARRGDAMTVLRMTCAALLVGKTFKEIVTAVVNGGGHADVNGATVGALAGACYGAAALPEKWLAVLTDRVEIENRADQLLVSALHRMLMDSAEMAS